jgi:hypothetical protein
MGNISLQRSPWKFLKLQTGPSDSCLLLLPLSSSLPLCSASAPAAHRRRNTPSATSCWVFLPRVAPQSCCVPNLLCWPSCRMPWRSGTATAAWTLASLCSPPRRMEEALEPPSSILWAHQYRKNPLDSFLPLARHFLAPRPRNAVAISPATLASSTPPWTHPCSPPPPKPTLLEALPRFPEATRPSHRRPACPECRCRGHSRRRPSAPRGQAAT